MTEALNGFLHGLSSPNVWASGAWLTLLGSLIVGGVWVIGGLSIERHVFLNKHPDWDFRAARNYLVRTTVLPTVGYVALLVLVWVVPQWLLTPDERATATIYQFGATGLIWLASNLAFQNELNHIRKPPPGDDGN